MHRVAVTGVGLVTPLGLDADSTFDALSGGRSALRKIVHHDAQKGTPSVAAMLSDHTAAALEARLPHEARGRAGRFVSFALEAAREALARAGDPHLTAPERYGVVTGVGIGVPHPSAGYRVGPTSILRVMPNGASAWISIALGLKGINLSCSTACASGAHAIGLALDHIRLGRAWGVVAGGVDTVVTPDVLRAFGWMRALNAAEDEDPTTMSRPFDATRRGFVLGEGAGFVMLEQLDRAKARGATVLAELVGFGATADAYSVVQVAPGGEGMARAMAQAMNDGGLSPADVDYISAHGTSTPMNDREETAAIRAVFGRFADKLAVSSQKSMLGHAMGGAGGIEAAVTVMTLQRQLITPTINLKNPDPLCDLDYVPDVSRKAQVRAALSNSFGFGGHNATLAFAHQGW